MRYGFEVPTDAHLETIDWLFIGIAEGWTYLALGMAMAIVFMMALSGCAAKKRPAPVVLVVPPQCVTLLELAGDCTISDKGISCPTRIKYACTKAVPAK